MARREASGVKDYAREVGKEVFAEKGERALNSAFHTVFGSAAHGAAEGIKQVVQHHFEKLMASEEAKARLWIIVASYQPVKSMMTHEKASQLLLKIQRDYSEKRQKPYNRDETYGEKAEDRLNSALGIFTRYIYEKHGDDAAAAEEELKNFLMHLASMSREKFDGFIECVLEDSMHKVVLFLSEFFDLSLHAAGELLQAIFNGIVHVMNISLDALPEPATTQEAAQRANQEIHNALDRIHGTLAPRGKRRNQTRHNNAASLTLFGAALVALSHRFGKGKRR